MPIQEIRQATQDRLRIRSERPSRRSRGGGSGPGEALGGVGQHVDRPPGGDVGLVSGRAAAAAGGDRPGPLFLDSGEIEAEVLAGSMEAAGQPRGAARRQDGLEGVGEHAGGRCANGIGGVERIGQVGGHGGSV
jgi:hypothetical protein